MEKKGGNKEIIGFTPGMKIDSLQAQGLKKQ